MVMVRGIDGRLAWNVNVYLNFQYRYTPKSVIIKL